MGAELKIKYHADADILTIAKCPSYPGQDEDEIDDLVCGRMNPDSGEIEYIEIVFFKARMEKDGEIVLPIDATLRLAEGAVPAD